MLKKILAVCLVVFFWCYWFSSCGGFETGSSVEHLESRSIISCKRFYRWFKIKLSLY
jgi:hypothetical protein